MMKWLLSLMVLSVIACSTQTTVDAKQEKMLIKQLADNWDAAIVNKDAKAVAERMSEDFRQISYEGTLSNKSEFLNNILSPKLTIQPYQNQDFDIRLLGDTALVTGRTQMQGSYDGKVFQIHYRYTDVYVKRDGQWRVNAVQITPVL